MFAPEGYVNLETMTDFLSDWANRIYLAHTLESLGKNHSRAFEGEYKGELLLSGLRHQQLKDNCSGQLEFTGRAWDTHVQSSREDAFLISIVYHCLLAKSLMKLDTLVCSHDGNIMRPDNYAFIHQDRLDWIYPRWPFRETGELSQIIKLFDDNKFTGLDLSRRYCFLDHGLGILLKKNASISGFREASHFGKDEFSDRFFRHQVEPFLGWSVVWRHDDLPENFVYFLDEISAFEEEWSVPTLIGSEDNGTSLIATSGSKRGAKPSGAKDEFFRRYPTGKPEDLSAEAIAAELSEAGFPISGRQVLNYAKEINND